MPRLSPLLLSLTLLGLSQPSAANDSSPRVGAGGITLRQPSEIRMAKEELTLSTKQIRVRYQFKNDSEQEIHATIDFPMPSYSWSPGVTPLSDNTPPMRNVHLLVNHQPITANRQRRAILGSRDITAELMRAGLSEPQIFDNFAEATPEGNGLDNDQRNNLTRLGALQEGVPIWQVAETRTWSQGFPAHGSVQIEHEYQPIVGTVYDAPYQRGFDSFTTLPTPSRNPPATTPAEACVDEGTRQAAERRIQKLIKNGAKIVWVRLEDVEYLLGTGHNWQGSIGEFTLRLEKQRPDQLISLCFPDKPQREGKQTLVFRQRNYTPQQRLVVYFYTIWGE